MKETTVLPANVHTFCYIVSGHWKQEDIRHELADKYDHKLYDIARLKFESLGFVFQDNHEFFKLFNKRVKTVFSSVDSLEDRREFHFDIYLDYVDENNTGTFICGYLDKVTVVHGENSSTVTSEFEIIESK